MLIILCHLIYAKFNYDSSFIYLGSLSNDPTHGLFNTKFGHVTS